MFTLFSKEKLSKMMIVFLPILITQLGLFAISFFDTFMSGKFSPVDLAGVAIGASLWMPIYNGFSGILLAVTPIVAQLFGQRAKPVRIRQAVMQAVYLALIMSALLIIIGGFSLNLLLQFMNLEEEVKQIALQYLIALSFGIVPLFVYTVLRCFIDALGKTSVSMFITIVALPVNVIANYAFIYGKFGLPAYGGVGAGIASSITYWIIMLIAILITAKVDPFSQYGLLRGLPKPSLKEWGNTMKIGLPIGMAIFFESSIFAAVTLFMSSYDTITIASHQAAMNFASFLYMVPLSFSLALTILVGQEAGAHQFKRAREFSLIGILSAVGFSGISAIILLVFREHVAYLYTNEPEVALLTAKFLIFAIFFQLSDALQAPIQGALRGYKDVNVTFFMTLLSYWIIGLPVGYFLANYTSFGAFGYWIGLITGLAIGAAGLSIRLIIVQRRMRASI
ncbi:MATE family efflux transporter [Pradoshia sp.]